MACGMLSVHYRNALRLCFNALRLLSWLHVGHYATTNLI